MKGYSHLQPSELCKISALAALNLSSAAIAAELKRHPATIRRERARSPGRYDEQTALDHRSAARSRCANNAQRWHAPDWQRVEHGLCRHHSPEQMRGRAWALGEPPLPSCSPIYTWLAEAERKDWKGLVKTDAMNLVFLLNHGVHNAIDIQTRVHARVPGRGGQISHRAGHGVTDAAKILALSVKTYSRWVRVARAGTLMSVDTHRVQPVTDSPRVLVATERMSLLTRLAFIPRNTAAAVLTGLQRWRGRRRGLFLSLPPDQGSEFAHLERFLPNSHIFACHPHSPWQKGIGENHNGLIRFYVPKGYPISELSPDYVQYVEDMINDLPRKSLDWLTPREVASLLHSACAL